MPGALADKLGHRLSGANGLDAIDELLTDELHVPPDDEANFKERLIHMRHGQFCFDSPKDVPDVGLLTAGAIGFIAFGCLNQRRKITEPVLETWVEILDQVPGSRLLLGYGGMDDQANVSRIIEALGAQGITPDRLTILGGEPHGEFLGRYNPIDFTLDTFLYSGALTKLEALWMGLPVITYPVGSCAARHAVSHLLTISHGEFIAGDIQGFINSTAELSCDVDRLARLGSGMCTTVAANPLSDRFGFAADFFKAVRDLWRERRQEG